MQLGDPDWKWRTASAPTRGVAVLCFVSLFGMLSSMMLAGYADHQALANPGAPTGLFVHAYEVKGGVRFVTDDLAELGRVSKRAMLVSLSSVAITWGLFHWLSLREKRNRAVR